MIIVLLKDTSKWNHSDGSDEPGSDEVKNTDLYLKIMVVGGRGEKSRPTLIFLSISQDINR